MRGASIRSSSTVDAGTAGDGVLLAMLGVAISCTAAVVDDDLSLILVASGAVLAAAGLVVWLMSPGPIAETDHRGMTLLDWACMHGPARHGGDAA